MRLPKKTIVVLLLLTTVLACAAAELTVLPQPAAGFWQVLTRIDPRDAAGRWVEFVLRRSVQALDDPYAAYMDNEEYAAFLTETLGTYSGIGVLIEEDGAYTKVVAVYEGGPAARVGFRPGDLITQIDGQNAIGSFAAAELLQGETGTTVALMVERDGVEIGPLVLGRETIRVNPVLAGLVAADIGYVAITSFNEHTHANFARELAAFKADGVKGIILDLRGNPGGLLDQGVAVAGQLLPAGPIVHILKRNGRRETLRAEGEGLALPLVVLIDGLTASTAEIVAGAVQDSRAGVLVGTRTYGKGTIQSLYGLGRGGGLKVTVAGYLTPNGRRIEGEGIYPDRVVAAGLPPAGGDAADIPGDRQLAEGIAVLEALLK